MAFKFETLRDHLVCPLTHAALVHEADTLVACEPEHRLQYAIRDDIPIMLVDEAQELSQEQWADIMERHGRSRETGEPITAGT